MTTHQFNVGELVELVAKLRRNAAPGPYEIVRLLPEVDGEPQYRIRSKHEHHERMANESGLERFNA